MSGKGINRVGYVYSNHRFAGEIIERNTYAGYEYTFTYHPNYLSISCYLPEIVYVDSATAGQKAD